MLMYIYTDTQPGGSSAILLEDLMYVILYIFTRLRLYYVCFITYLHVPYVCVCVM